MKSDPPEKAQVRMNSLVHPVHRARSRFSGDSLTCVTALGAPTPIRPSHFPLGRSDISNRCFRLSFNTRFTSKKLAPPRSVSAPSLINCPFFFAAYARVATLSSVRRMQLG